ncbi:MAG: hypothetical protein ACD_47C00081G0002 [uncultured bacterium]|nr:MAG: hypothetical protein ACD_47C00081G0002 [uncultured bacterium]
MPVLFFNKDKNIVPFHFAAGTDLKVGNSKYANLEIKAGKTDSVHFTIKSEDKNYFVDSNPSDAIVEVHNEKTGRRAAVTKINQPSGGGSEFNRQSLISDDFISVNAGGASYTLIFKLETHEAPFDFSGMLAGLLGLYSADLGMVDVYDINTGKVINTIVQKISNRKFSKPELDNVEKIKKTFFNNDGVLSFGAVPNAVFRSKFTADETHSVLLAPLYSSDEKMRATIYLHREIAMKEDFTQKDYEHILNETRGAYALYENSVLKKEIEAVRQTIKDMRCMATCGRDFLTLYKCDIINGASHESQEAKELRRLIYFFRYFSGIDIFCDFSLEMFLDKIISLFNADMGIIDLKDFNTGEIITIARRAGEQNADLYAERYLKNKRKYAIGKKTFKIFTHDYCVYTMDPPVNDIHSVMMLSIENSNGIVEGLIYLQRDRTGCDFIKTEAELLSQLIQYFKSFLKLINFRKASDFISSSFSTLYNEAAKVLCNSKGNLDENRIFDVSLVTLSKIVQNFYMAAFMIEFEGKNTLFYLAPEGLEQEMAVKKISDYDAKWKNCNPVVRIISKLKQPSADYKGNLHTMNFYVKGHFSNFEGVFRIYTSEDPITETEQSFIKILKDEITLALERHYALISSNKKAFNETISGAMETMNFGILIYNADHEIEFTNGEFGRLGIIRSGENSGEPLSLRSVDLNIRSLCESAFSSGGLPVHGLHKTIGNNGLTNYFSMSAVELKTRSGDGQKKGVLLMSSMANKLIYLKDLKHDFINSFEAPYEYAVRENDPVKFIDYEKIAKMVDDNYDAFYYNFASLCLANDAGVKEMFLASMEIKKISLAALVDEIKRLEVLLKKKNIKLTIDLKDNIDQKKNYIETDILAMRRVFTNIFKNCARYAAGGQTIQKLIIRLTDSGRKIEFISSDNGPGLSPFIVNKLRQTDTNLSRDDHGRGLFIVKTIIKLLTGEELSINEDVKDTDEFKTVYGFKYRIVN